VVHPVDEVVKVGLEAIEEVHEGEVVVIMVAAEAVSVEAVPPFNQQRHPPRSIKAPFQVLSLHLQRKFNVEESLPISIEYHIDPITEKKDVKSFILPIFSG
jgi:hypothetical protein